MDNQFTCSIKRIRFDENYQPADNTRLTTNFANLARGESRQENLRRTLAMINQRFNSLATSDNPKGDRYSLEIDIISAELDVEGNGQTFPFIEMLKSTVIDHQTNERIEGMIGNSFSSYVRDYDFSVVLPSISDKTDAKLDDFGDLHGKLYQHLIHSDVFKAEFKKQPVICLSVSTTKTYYRTAHVHPVLCVEYKNDDYSRTDAYFRKMGLSVRYFKPEHGNAPLAFYFAGDLLRDYTDFELISAISTMESFQKIYRPEIYNTNSPAGLIYQPSLNYQDYSLTQIVYDRVERSQLAVKQGKWTEENFIKPYKDILEKWAANFTVDNAHQEHTA
ncbi:putative oxygenase MesX [Acinetobacter variabilis]|uniref:putative oxygenase MesX n=1 Tax=Acinetobacter variabilis TaxID=70346 RepID=UPI00254C971F|nr:putative oxygenase MesX [Acinetobacter variabilis]